MTTHCLQRSVALVAVLAVAVAHAAGCTGEAAPTMQTPTAADATGQATKVPPRLMIFDTLEFTRQKPVGVAPGFDLDKVVSKAGNMQTCGHADLKSPTGAKGIDNQFAKLVPLLEQTQVGAIHGLVQNAIEDGGLLIMLQLEGVDDTLNDDEVSLRVRLGKGKPLLGTDGLVLAGQTFHLHPESPEIALTAQVKGGVVDGGPFKMRLPIIIFDVLYEITIHDALIRFTFDADGGLKGGLIGGGVPISDIMTIAYTAAMNAGGILEAIEPVVKGMGDLHKGPDGKCHRISAVLGFSAVSAFLFEG